MSNLVEVPCLVCGAPAEGMQTVRSSDRDDPAYFYGDLYGEIGRSVWKVCDDCGFVHQNPRPSEEALQELFSTGDYHQEALPEIFKTAEGFRRYGGSSYFTKKVDHFVRETGLKGGRVFDVGCGTGCILYNLAGRGLEVAGCEPDPDHCKVAKKYNPEADIGQYLLTAKSRPEGKFDAVFSHHVFEHFANLSEAVDSMVSILKPGGYVFTVVPTYFENRTKGAVRAMNSGHYSMFTHQTMNRLFAGHGLEEVSHTYRGAWAWSDELWHLARFTGKAYGEPPAERPDEVRRYVDKQTVKNERMGAITYLPFRAVWKVWDSGMRALKAAFGRYK